jgi:hypothetical protein
MSGHILLLNWNNQVCSSMIHCCVQSGLNRRHGFAQQTRQHGCHFNIDMVIGVVYRYHLFLINWNKHSLVAPTLLLVDQW